MSKEKMMRRVRIRRVRMVGFRPWFGAGIMLVATMQTVAAIPTAAKRATTAAATGTAPHLAVFSVHPSTTSSSVAVTAGRLDNTLTAVAQAYPSMSTSDHPIASLHAVNPAAHFRLETPTTTPEVLVDVITKGDPQNLKAELAGLGMRDIAVFSNDVGGWLPVDQLASASALADLHFARASMPRTRSSVVATQGDFAQMSSTLRTTYPGLTGSGVTIGVLSDSFNCFATYGASGSGVPASGYNGYAPFGFTATYADDQTPTTGQAASTAALPGNVTVLAEASCLNYGAPYQLPFTDEGRAILQIIHAVAPGASLAFYTAVNSEADFASGITKLAANGAKIIDDDVGYPDEPFFQDGIVAQAIDTVAAEGVAYFSSAGNDGNLSYENTTPSFSVAGSGSQSNEKVLNFDPSGASTTTSLPLSIPKLAPGEYISVVVEWDSPYVTGAPNSGGSTASIDICLSGNSSDLITDYNSFPSTVSCTGGSGTGNDPVQILLIGNPANASGYSAAETVSVTLGLVNGTTAPGRVKLVVEADGAAAAINSPFNTNSPTLQGHPGATGAAAVGAAFYFNTPQCGATTPTLESFSALAGDPILFDTTGTRLGTPTVRNKPDFVAPDGVNNTMLGAPLTDGAPTGVNVTAVNATSIAGCKDNESFPSFFGTSAAAPHAAAAAALMMQAAPTMTAAQIISTLQSTAIAMTSSSSGTYDYLDGHGFIDINAAFAGITVGVASITVSPTTITIGSSATLSWSGTNVSGCTASGSWTGSQSASGTQTVTPTAVGTETFTLTCTTTAGATVTSSAALDIATASSSSSSSSSSSGFGVSASSLQSKGGGALDLSTLLALGGVLLAGRAFYNAKAS
jgi:Subtilase family